MSDFESNVKEKFILHKVPVEKEKVEEPPLWVVEVSHQGHFCSKPLVDALVEVFAFPHVQAITYALTFRTTSSSPPYKCRVGPPMPCDLAKTKVYLANAVAVVEQQGCICRSSLEFTALPLKD